MKSSKGKSAEDRIIEAAQDWAAQYVEQRFDDEFNLLDRYGSPIERIFAAALTTLIRFGFTPFQVMHEEEPFSYKRSGDRALFLESQARLLDWPVDFAIKMRDPFTDRVKTIAVECDGHDFHERTKHQAAKDRSRDRALQAAGFTVLRFTGSELWTDPIGCAKQVVAILEDAFDAYVQDYVDKGRGS